MTSSFKGITQLSSGALLVMASLMVFLATIGVTQAQDLCANIDYLIAQSRSQFAEIMDKPNGDGGDHDVTLNLAARPIAL